MIFRIIRTTVVFIAATALMAYAQTAGGSIAGQVRDASGAAVAGAKVSVNHAETGATRQTTTAGGGEYAFPNLAVGTYTITAEHTGFKQLQKRGVVLHVSEQVGADLVLEVGELSERISVESTVAEVRTESSEQGGVITGSQVRELQLNGRSFMTLLELVPGVASNMDDRADPNSSPNLSINGARSSAFNFRIDGGNNADVMVGSSSLNTFTSIETIAEFNVLTSNFSAEYGQSGVSQINVVTRSGTRDLHGSLYEFFRNDRLDAKDFISHQKLPLKMNDFGYTLGGPVVLGGYNRDRSKTFFFVAQEFNRLSTQNTAQNITVPTAAEREGDFSASALKPIDPATKSPFPDNRIPASRIDENAAKIVSLYPRPNFSGSGTTNFTSAAAAQQPFREDMFRIDHIFNDKVTLYGRYTQDSATIDNPYGGSSATGIYTRFPGIGNTKADRPGRNLVVNTTQIFRPTVVNQINFSYSRRVFDMYSTSTRGSKSELGVNIPEVYPENEEDTLPVITMTNYAGINVARRGHKELFTLEFSDNLSYITGRHMFRFGGYYNYAGNREQKFNPNVSGTFTFDTAIAGNDIAALLLGMPTRYSEVEKTVWTDMRFGAIEFFAQDDIKLTPRLTLNLGLRVSNYLQPYDRDDAQSNFVPSLYSAAKAFQINPSTGTRVLGTGDELNGIVRTGVDSPYGRKLTDDNTFLLGPRFGLAWSPLATKHWVWRGGYGVYYTRTMLGTYADTGLSNPPFTQTTTIEGGALTNPGGGTIVPATAVVDLTTLGLPMKAPTIQQWSFGTEFDLVSKAVLSVNYIGSRGTHLLQPVNINAPEPGLAAARGVKVNAVRPYLGYGSITQRQTTGNSSYNSLQVSLNRQVGSGISVGAAYTYAKSIDDSSSDRGSGDVPPDLRNLRAERAISDYDRMHVLTSNFTWDIPRLARGALSNPVFRTAFDGWQVSGIARMWSGMPFDVVLSQDVAGIGAVQNQRPNIISNTKGSRTTGQWFNTAAFGRPADGTFGNMGRNSLRLPGVNKWDLAATKNFMFSESARLQFRAEFFNAFNHPSLSAVGSTLSTTATGVNPASGNFGVVTDSRDARVIQFALKLAF
jgi:hypothetical protein